MADIPSAEKPGELTDEELEGALGAALADADSDLGADSLALSFRDAVCADDDLMKVTVKATSGWLQHVAVTGGIGADRVDEIDDTYDYVVEVAGGSYITVPISVATSRPLLVTSTTVEISFRRWRPASS